MLPRLFAAVVTLLLTGCSRMEVTALFGPRDNGYYTELAAQLHVVGKLNGRRVCAYVHESEIKNGAPFNDNAEQTSDFLGCGLRWSK